MTWMILEGHFNYWTITTSVRHTDTVRNRDRATEYWRLNEFATGKHVGRKFYTVGLLNQRLAKLWARLHLILTLVLQSRKIFIHVLAT